MEFGLHRKESILNVKYRLLDSVKSFLGHDQHCPANDNVLTLVATAEGLQIRGPGGQFVNPMPIQQFQHDEENPGYVPQTKQCTFSTF